MLIVEDWAEIRRLWKSEGVSISEIARVVGCSRNTVKAALASDGPPRYVRVAAGSLVRRFRAADPGAVAGVSADAGDGDRGADRLVVLDSYFCERTGGGAAACVSAAGPSEPDCLCRRGGGAV